MNLAVALILHRKDGSTNAFLDMKSRLELVLAKETQEAIIEKIDAWWLNTFTLASARIGLTVQAGLVLCDQMAFENVACRRSCAGFGLVFFSEYHLGS